MVGFFVVMEKLLLGNGPSFAGFSTFATGGTFGGVDDGAVVFYRYSAAFAGFYAKATSDTAYLTNLYHRGTLVEITTTNGVGATQFFQRN